MSSDLSPPTAGTLLPASSSSPTPSSSPSSPSSSTESFSSSFASSPFDPSGPPFRTTLPCSDILAPCSSLACAYNFWHSSIASMESRSSATAPAPPFARAASVATAAVQGSDRTALKLPKPCRYTPYSREKSHAPFHHAGRLRLTSDAGRGHAPADSIAASWVSSANSLSTDLLIISSIRMRLVHTLQFAAFSLPREPRFHEPTMGSAGRRSPPGDSRRSLSARYLASGESGSSLRCTALIRSQVASWTSCESCLGLDAGFSAILSLAHRPSPNRRSALRTLSFSC
mmetsp:Transcript_2004/g.7544  ORF Transcript_2004/g.7544 Transcript_2004/m.7544 type:complete len:286 (+) Transcript_2004:1480-2337(+)